MASDLEPLFTQLSQSVFRQRFRLGDLERDYLHRKGLAVILDHGADFIAQRLALAYPIKDGKQTPWRGHPVFITQHATGTCCRRCLQRWHQIPLGKPLTVSEQQYILSVIEVWLRQQIATERSD